MSSAVSSHVINWSTVYIERQLSEHSCKNLWHYKMITWHTITHNIVPPVPNHWHRSSCNSANNKTLSYWQTDSEHSYPAKVSKWNRLLRLQHGCCSCTSRQQQGFILKMEGCLSPLSFILVTLSEVVYGITDLTPSSPPIFKNNCFAPSERCCESFYVKWSFCNVTNFYKNAHLTDVQCTL